MSGLLFVHRSFTVTFIQCCLSQILPIESSMEGNRHLFPAFLHLAIYIVFFILTAFGVLGYLRYGDNVQQIILLSIPQHSPLAIAVDITLIISVLFTYPLQMFPFIQIVECYIFGPGIFGVSSDVQNTGWQIIYTVLPRIRQGIISVKGL